MFFLSVPLFSNDAERATPENLDNENQLPSSAGNVAEEEDEALLIRSNHSVEISHDWLGNVQLPLTPRSENYLKF